jgi:hypothetical protein
MNSTFLGIVVIRCESSLNQMFITLGSPVLVLDNIVFLLGLQVSKILNYPANIDKDRD